MEYNLFTIAITVDISHKPLCINRCTPCSPDV